MKVSVDQTKCIAAGHCVMHAEAVFDQRDDDGIVVLLDDNPPESLADDVRHAAAVCPASAIDVQD